MRHAGERVKNAKLTKFRLVVDLVDATLCDWIATDASQKHASASDNRTRAPLGRRSLEPTADRTRGVGRRNRWTLVSVVAGLVALVAVSVYLPFGDPGPTSEPAADLTQVEPQTPAMGSTNLGVREAALLNQAGAAYGTLARSAAGAIEEFAWIMIPGRPMSPADAENDPAEGRWIDGLQHQLQPIGKSLGDAFDFLWEVGRPPDDTRT
jgi:hypothetical protein